MADVKVLIGEKDGEEFSDPKEYQLKAEDVPFDNTGTTIQATDVQGAILEAGKTTTNLSFDDVWVQSSSYVRIGSVIFRGSQNQPAPAFVKASAYCDDGVTAQLRLLDSSNNTVIAESAAFSNTTEQVIDFGTVSNIPTDAAVFEIQMRRTVGTGTSKGFITAFQMGS